MKNILKTFGLLLLSGTAFVACDDYLDRQPDEQLTAAQIFQKAKTTEQYLTNVYGYQSNYSDPSGQILPWSCCDDDGSIVFTGRNYSLINYDTWNPNNDIYRSQTYNNLYKGIREANYFMQHVFECPEMSEIDKGYHYNEARFLRAYYYSLLQQPEQIPPLFRSHLPHRRRSGRLHAGGVERTRTQHVGGVHQLRGE